jgi:DNA-directed RNA polymerase specialized sigma subunit
MIQHNEELNKELKEFMLRVQKTHDSRELEKYFKKVKPLLMKMIKRFKDPSGVLTEEDFMSFALQGFWKATNKYDESHSDNAIFWVINLVRQRISREIKYVNRKTKNVINSHINPNLDIYNIHVIEETSRNGFKISQEYNKEISELHDKIFYVSRKAAQTFQLRLAFPYIDRTCISIILGLKRRTGVAKFVKIIRTVSNNQLNEEILNDIK